MSKLIEKKLVSNFERRKTFSKEELYEFFKNYEPDLKESTLTWRIYDLKKKNIIRTVKRGEYVVSFKPIYRPQLSSRAMKIAKIISQQFEDVKYCIWETMWLNEFLRHQSPKNITLIEIEKEFVESLFFKLKDQTSADLYVNPDETVIDYYVYESGNPVIVRKLITRSPISIRHQNKTRIITPALEKVLVDIFADKKIFQHIQNLELVHTYEGAIKNYAVNFTRLFSYARRRDRDQAIKSFLFENLNHLIRDIIDD